MSAGKHGLSPDEFKDHYENKHIHLFKDLLGAAFPKSHVRHYTARGPATSEPPYGAQTLIGQPSDVAWDAIDVLTFEDEEQYEKAMAALSDEKAAKKLTAEEKTFCDSASIKMMRLRDVWTTLGGSE